MSKYEVSVAYWRSCSETNFVDLWGTVIELLFEKKEFVPAV
jgi:hypothetical protein